MVMDVEKYAKMLRERHLKVTPQRLEVLRFLDENRTHPTADDIYRALRKKNPSLSKTTVYNVLDVLGECNMVDVLTISGTEARYDLRESPHHHFLCKSCGVIIDVDIEGLCLDCFPEKGHKVEEVHGYFKGICKDCLRIGG
ncbi:MAG: Fur family transcriptional regulator [Thermoplasmata archaeon]